MSLRLKISQVFFMLLAFAADASASAYSERDAKTIIQGVLVQVGEQLETEDSEVATLQLRILRSLNSDFGRCPAFAEAYELYSYLEILAHGIAQRATVGVERSVPPVARAGAVLFQVMSRDENFLQINYYPDDTIGDLKNRINVQRGLSSVLQIFALGDYEYLNQQNSVDNSPSIPDSTRISELIEISPEILDGILWIRGFPTRAISVHSPQFPAVPKIPGMRWVLLYMNDLSIEVNVPPGATFGELKTALENTHGIQAKDIHIVYMERIRDDDELVPIMYNGPYIIPKRLGG